MAHSLNDLRGAVNAAEPKMSSIKSQTGRSGEASILDWSVSAVSGIDIFDSFGNAVSDSSSLNCNETYTAKLSFTGQGPHFSDIMDIPLNFQWQTSGDATIAQSNGFEADFSTSGSGTVEGKLVDGFNQDANQYDVFMVEIVDCNDGVLQ